MFDYFKNLAEKNSCQSIGVCSIHPSVYALYELFMNEIRETSFYLVKLKEFNLLNKEIMQICLSALSIFLINTNFNKANFINFLKNLTNSKHEAKNKYLSYCKTKQIPFETINSDFEIKQDATISDLIKYSQKYILKKQDEKDKSKQNLFDLISLFAKLSAINLIKIKKFDKNYEEYDFEILRFFALTNSYAIRNEKLKRRIYEFCEIERKIKEKLAKLNEEKYGKKEFANISCELKKGYNILVSGDDLYDLEQLLLYLEKSNLKEKINVYTHGALIKAHNYPYFKNNKFLKGHIGLDNAEYDFSLFDGAILITQNFTQKIDGLYRGEIFSNKLISFEKVIDIANYDFENLINTTLKLKPFEKNSNKCSNIQINYNYTEYQKIIENLQEKELTIILNKPQKDSYQNQYKNKNIINLNCPIEDELLYKLSESAKQKEIKLSVFISQCSLSNIDVLFSLLDKNYNFYLAQCPNIIISPHITQALIEEFKIKAI